MRITIIRPCSREQGNLLAAAIEFLENQGFTVDERDIPTDPDWPFCAGGIAERARLLNETLADDDIDIVWIARGGYGAGELLSLINWEGLKARRSKYLVGFSDVTALHWPVTQILGWPCLHAPMPATVLWNQDGNPADILSTLQIFTQSGSDYTMAIKALRFSPLENLPLMGGCLSVVTSLIGTKYLKNPNEPFVFFFEDTGENPARLMRFLTQCQDSGLLDHCHGMLIGDLRDIGADDARNIFLNEVQRRCRFPLWETNSFGHVHPNFPILLGAKATLSETELIWHHEI